MTKTDKIVLPETKEPKFRQGDQVRLPNKWSRQFSNDGVCAVVKSIRHDKNGEPIYFVEAERPPIPVHATEAELKI